MRSWTEAATAGINLREGVGGLHLWGEASFLLPQQGDTEKRERTSVRSFSQREELLRPLLQWVSSILSFTGARRDDWGVPPGRPSQPGPCKQRASVFECNEELDVTCLSVYLCEETILSPFILSLLAFGCLGCLICIFSF